jgi:hypothetical protein
MWHDVQNQIFPADVGLMDCTARSRPILGSNQTLTTPKQLRTMEAHGSSDVVDIGQFGGKPPICG